MEVRVVSKLKISPVRTPQSKSPFGPPEPSKEKAADSCPSPHSAAGVSNRACVSSKERCPSPPKSNGSWNSSLRRSEERLVNSTARVGATAKSSSGSRPAWPTMSWKPASTRARKVLAGGRTPIGSSRTVAPDSVPFSTRVTRVAMRCQVPALSRNSRRSRLEARLVPAVAPPPPPEQAGADRKGQPRCHGLRCSCSNHWTSSTVLRDRRGVRTSTLACVGGWVPGADA